MRVKKFYAGALLLCSCLGLGGSRLALAKTLVDEEHDEASFWGSHLDVSLGIGVPDFRSLTYYAEAYGNPKVLPELSVRRDIVRYKALALQGGFGLGYYSDSGHELKVNSDGELEQAAGKVELNLTPYRIFAALEIDPLPSSFVSLLVWCGYEELYFRERRVTMDHTQSTSTSTQTSDPGVYLNTGWNHSVVFGGALPIDVSWVEEKNVISMEKTMGFSRILFAPYFEYTTKLSGDVTWLSRKSSSPVNFQRQVYGISFIFESQG